MKPAGGVLSIFDIHPTRIDGTAMFARAISKYQAEQGLRSILCFPSQPTARVMEFLSLPNVTIEAGPRLFDPRPLVYGPAYMRIARRYRPSIVHVHFMGFISALPWLAKTCGAKAFFFTDHTSRPEDDSGIFHSRWKRLATRAIAHPVQQVVAVSEFSRTSLCALRRLPAHRYSMIRNGIDLERVAESAGARSNFRERFAIPADRTLVTQVSWLIPQKGVADLIDAAALVLRSQPAVHFCVVGTGPSLAGWKNDVEAAGMAGSFTFTGQVEDPFFEGVFAATDILCQPSRWQEAFCWAVAEAMAFGKPAVATRVGAIPELVEHGKTGFVVNPRSPQELADRLLELISNPALRHQMGEAAATAARERFALTRNVEEHLRMYGLLSAGIAAA